MVTIIVAMTNDRVIGANGQIPWKIKDDMKLFKSLTEGNTVIMGKATWLSLPAKFRPLPNRSNIVVSTTLPPQEGAHVVKSIEGAIEAAKKNNNEIYCIGGSKLYGAALPHADKLCISWVKEPYKGDTYFPAINFNDWRIVETKEFAEFTFKRYLRTQSSSSG
ncbi:MAG: dihydrofolate reductase [Candidatus Micrarchaeota archaeon]|nr:dihydrofolate reductase [Candidatus Micrarchaeota archaeon]